MFCPQCGAKNPDNAKFCAACGRPMPVRATGGPVAGHAGVAATQEANDSAAVFMGVRQAIEEADRRRRANRPKRIALAIVVALAVVGAAAFGITRFFDTGLPTGSVIFSGGTSYRFAREGLNTRLTVSSTDLEGITTDQMTGILRKDGSNENGTIFRMTDVTDMEGDASGYDTLEFRFQFPAGIGDGELQGTWIMERMSEDEAGELVPVRDDVQVFRADGSMLSASYDFSNGSEGSLIDNPRSIEQLQEDAQNNDGHTVWSCSPDSPATWGRASDGSYRITSPYVDWVLPVTFYLD